MEAEDMYSKCPRMLLSHALERLEREWGNKALAGFEIERERWQTRSFLQILKTGRSGR
jgi:hypothetical protein